MRVIAMVAAALLLAAASPARAASGEPSTDAIGAELDRLHRQDVRVAAIAYRLARANLALCHRTSTLAGIVVQTAGLYDADVRPIARARLRLGELPTVIAVAPGSAADRAGVRTGDVLQAVDGVRLAPDRKDARRGSLAAVRDAYDAIEIAGRDGSYKLRVSRDGAQRELQLAPEHGCAGRAQLVPSERVNAAADDRHITVTTAIAERAGSDDALAAVMAHEFAHVILDHKHRLGAKRGHPSPLARPIGAERLTRRAAEREADYLAMHLAARAGYDINLAPAAWRAMAASYRGDKLAAGSQPDSPERTRTIALAIAEIAAKRRAGLPILPAGWRGER